MSQLNVRTKIIRSTLPSVSSAQAAVKAMCEELAKDMADQVRANIVRFGKPGGDGGWPPLSGYNQAAIATHQRAAKAHKAAAGRTEGEQSKKHREQAKKHRKTVKNLKAKQASKHSGYARAKELGETPGHGKFKASDLLRDTEALFASLAGKVIGTATAIIVRLVAEGTAPTRSISNQRLLEIHSFGEGNMPKRDPTQKMDNFEKRFAARLKALHDKFFGAK